MELNAIGHIVVAVPWAPQVASYALTFLATKGVLSTPRLAEEQMEDQDRSTLGLTLLVWCLANIALGYYLIAAGYSQTGLYMLLPTCVLSLPLSVAGLKIEDGTIVLFRKDRIESSPLWLIGGALALRWDSAASISLYPILCRTNTSDCTTGKMPCTSVS